MLAGWQAFTNGISFWPVFWLSAAFITAVVTILKPVLLTPFNYSWMQLALFLNRIVSPLVLGLMYVAVIVPVGMIMWLIGRDTMQRHFISSDSYWNARTDGRFDEPERFTTQF